MGRLTMSGMDGLLCVGRELLLSWLFIEPFVKPLFEWTIGLDGTFVWYDGFDKLSRCNGLSLRTGINEEDLFVCFTLTFLPISPWLGFISLVLKRKKIKEKKNYKNLYRYLFFFWFSSATVIRCLVVSYTSSLARIRILYGMVPNNSSEPRGGPDCCKHSKLPPGPSISAVLDTEKLNDVQLPLCCEGNDNCYKQNKNLIKIFFKQLGLC